MRDFAFGFITYFKGLIFSFSHPKTRKIIFVTAFINLIIFVVVLLSASFKVSGLIKSHFLAPEHWYQYISYYFVYLLALVGIFFMSALVVYFLSTVFMIRIGDVLSRLIMEESGVPVVSGPKRPVAVLLKAVCLTGLTTMAFLISLIPGFGIIGLLLSSLLLSFDMTDYGFDHLGLTLPQRLAFFRSHFALVLGFSTGLMIVMTLPVINVLFLPSGIVSSSYLLTRIRK